MAESIVSVPQQRTKHRWWVLLVTVAIVWNISQSQNVGKISGVLRDVETGESLVGANIIVIGTTLGASTDIEGSYYILNVPPGSYDLRASMIGFQKTIQQGVIVNAGRTTVADFKLKSSAVQAQEVVIQATRPDVQAEKTSTSEIIRSDEVQQLAGMRDVGDVLALAADVTDGHFRGGREGEELYTLQGMGIVNPLNSSTAFLPIMSAVEEVEVITSGFGAQYGNAQSGVVNISMKEGKSDKWRTRAETRVRLPGFKHFGSSVYDPAANPYLQILQDPNTWRTSDSQGKLYYTNMFSGGGNRFGYDTLAQVQVAYALYRLQQRKDLNRTYGDELDRSIEVAAGGPLDHSMRMFLAFRSNVTWPFLPTDQPDVQRQLMGNIVADVGDGASLRLSAAYAQTTENVFNSLTNSVNPGFYNWLWDRTMAIDDRRSDNSQFGIRFTQALSASTFYEVKLNTLYTKVVSGSPLAPQTLPDSVITKLDWARMLAEPVRSPDNFSYGSAGNNSRSEKTRTISLDASLTSQVTKSHLLNAGLQFNSYNVDVANRSSLRSSTVRSDFYGAKPYELGIFVQDKMEFEGMISNVGLRMDLWNQNTDYYSDLYSPFRVTTEDTVFINRDLAAKTKSTILARLQPRVGVSFPVSTTTVFHLNYGTFMQRPSIQYTAYSSMLGGSQITQLGNPRLEPQVTNSYDMGVVQGLGEGFTIDFSGYYKDVRNLIELALFSPTLGSNYSTYVNRDYADIRGFRISVNRRRGSLTGSLNYHYSVATGKSSNALNNPPTYYENKPPDLGTPRDILLDFDRTHNLIANLAYSTGDVFGPVLFDSYPLSDLILSASSYVRSGRPYTSYQNVQRLINDRRSPSELNTNIKITKRLRKFFGGEATIYFEVFNLLNDKTLSYGYVFQQRPPSTTGAATDNKNIDIYQREGEAGLRYYDIYAPLLVDQSFILYDSTPRSYNLGFVIEF
jgi:outer membrane receptor protein involved in Fe transport